MLGDSAPDDVANQSPGDALDVIRDHGLEWAPQIAAIIGAVFLVGLTMYLVRRGLAVFRRGIRL